jgi:hypothetical protein
MRLKHSAEEADEVRREGHAAARAGASEHDNPYDRLTMAYRHWRAGFGLVEKSRRNQEFVDRSMPAFRHAPNDRRPSRCF